MLHAIIRKNYGCTHIIIGRDHAGPGKDSKGRPFYGMYDAQDLLRKHENEIGIQMEPFEYMVYLPHKKVYSAIDKVKNSEVYKTISGSELRSILDRGEEIPKWYTYPDVANELKNQFPQSIKEGLLFFSLVFLDLENPLLLMGY